MGTLYRRFSNKEALIEQLVNDLFERVLEAGRRAMCSDEGTGLEIFLRRAVELQETHRGCMSRLWESPLPDAFLIEFDELLNRLLAQAQSAGRIRADCVATDLSVVLWASQGVVEATGGWGRKAWERHLDIVLSGLRPGASPLERPPISHDQRIAIARSRRGKR